MSDQEACAAEIQQLARDIERLRAQKNGHRPLAELARQTNHVNQYAQKGVKLKTKRELKGHFGKIYAMHWSAKDSRQLVSASQDGKLIVWNGFTTNKVHAIPLQSSWVMTCAYSPTGTMLASGGLDNRCSVYKVPDASEEGKLETIHKTYAELSQHDGYLSCCRFLGGNSTIVTSSGDSTCILWDVETRSVKQVFTKHTGDVMSVSVADHSDLFVSGSCDFTANVWDHRQFPNKPAMTFPGHESDINSVQMFPDGNCFGTGSDDSTCRLFDIRCFGELNVYQDDKTCCGVTSIDFSKSGECLFAGYDDYTCCVWDTMRGEKLDELKGHQNRVACLGVTKDGQALCTGSWDASLRIWS